MQAADEFREKHADAFKKGVLFKGLVADLKRVETAETKASKRPSPSTSVIATP